MASTIAVSTFSCSSSIGSIRPTMNTCYTGAACSSNCVVVPIKFGNLCLLSRFCEVGRGRFGSSRGIRQMGSFVYGRNERTGRRGRCRRNVVCASLFGVGAPEALVIGVVALLVFGPKGLAEVARNLGKTLRAFQPTIRELQEVSREFKSSLEREIGLDDVPISLGYDSSRGSPPSSPLVSSTDVAQPDVPPNGSTPSRAYTSEELLKITEEQLKSSAALQQSPLGDIPAEPKSTPEASVQESAAQAPTTQKPES
ncbi:Sec-independent protein translocase protein TATB, chloroplastic-like protein [Drosera capensis]